MILPQALRDIDEETALIGDIDAFMQYVEDGFAWRDWNNRIAIAQKDLDDSFP